MKNLRIETNADELAKSLFETIRHGDDEHQEWLKAKAWQWAINFIADHKVE